MYVMSYPDGFSSEFVDWFTKNFVFIFIVAIRRNVLIIYRILSFKIDFLFDHRTVGKALAVEIYDASILVAF